MTETKWTPGPWRHRVGGNLGNAIEAYTGEWEYGEKWEIVATFQCAPTRSKHPDDMVNAKANGDLIASAPELYEALERMVEFFQGYQGMELTTARAALAKARGESND